MKNLSVILLLVILLTTCRSDDDSLLNDELIDLVGLPENPHFTEGYNAITFTITIHPDASSAFRKIILKSEGGTFSPDSLIISKATNQAEAIFRPGSTEGTFELRASVQGHPEIYVIRHITLKKQSPGEIISIGGFDSTEYATDPFNKITFTVRRLIEGDNAYRRIKLDSEGGIFNPSTVIFNEGDLEEDVEFIPGLAPGEFTIRAMLESNPDIFVEKQFRLVHQSLAEVLEIQLTEDSAKADGLTILEGTLILKNTNERTVKLVTTDPEGTFLPENKKEIVVEASDNKEIKFKLLAGKNPGIYFIQGYLQDDRNLVAEDVYELFPLRSDEVLNITFNVDSIPADSTTPVTAQGILTNYENGKVLLTSNLGRFEGSSESQRITVEPDPSGRFEFRFIASTKVADHVITANVEGTSYTITKVLKADRVYPESIYLEPSLYEIDSAGGSLTIRAVLVKDNGEASDGTLVTFSAQQLQQGQIINVGSFKGLPAYSQNQAVSVKFDLDTRKAVTGVPITITASLAKTEDEVISEAIDIQVYHRD